jgi:probable F420-dependent oxidoreductase
MPRIELGPIGAVVNPSEGDAFVRAAVELERLGYSTIWLTGGPLSSLRQIADVVRTTSDVRVASGIISVDRFDATDVAALHAELEASHPGRFVVGLGGAHGPQPLPTLNAYLDELDELGAVPASARIMAALGPRMLDLARNRAAGAFPVLVTPEYIAEARARLGGDTTLAVEQLVVVETDPDRARAIARGPLGFLGTAPGYIRSFRRIGFTDHEITGLANRLVDALVSWGDVDSIAAHVAAQREAGADHVAISVITDSADTVPVDQLCRLAAALIPG